MFYAPGLMLMSRGMYAIHEPNFALPRTNRVIMYEKKMILYTKSIGSTYRNCNFSHCDSLGLPHCKRSIIHIARIDSKTKTANWKHQMLAKNNYLIAA